MVAVWGCAAQAPAPAGGSAAAAPSVSFDGHYDGTVQLVGAASGFDPHQCATDPRLSLQVTNSEFTYVQPHPNAGAMAQRETTATYTATIAPDGTIRGSSANLSGGMSGRVTGTHMSGQINGVVCYYSFAADRA
jgi:hypothetical protein